VDIENLSCVGDPMSTGETGELGPLNASSAACLDALMSKATELGSPGCANDKRSPGGINDRRILDCAIDDMRSSG
jgi:hypothetical protein